jgi:hypothetical protein
MAPRFKLTRHASVSHADTFKSWLTPSVLARRYVSGEEEARERASSLHRETPKRYLQPGSFTVWPGGWHLAPPSFGPLLLLPGPKSGSAKAVAGMASAPIASASPTILRMGPPCVVDWPFFPLGHGAKTCVRAIGDAETGRTLSAHTLRPSSEPTRGWAPVGVPKPGIGPHGPYVPWMTLPRRRGKCQAWNERLRAPYPRGLGTVQPTPCPRR